MKLKKVKTKLVKSREELDNLKVGDIVDILIGMQERTLVYVGEFFGNYSFIERLVNQKRILEWQLKIDYSPDNNHLYFGVVRARNFPLDSCEYKEKNELLVNRGL